MRHLVVLAVALPLLAAIAVAAETPIQLCDQLAASPVGENGGAPGVARDKLDFKKAIPACRSAVAAFPDIARFSFALARAYDVAGDDAAAFAAYGEAVAKGSTLALINLASMYKTVAGRHEMSSKPLRSAKRHSRPAGLWRPSTSASSTAWVNSASPTWSRRASGSARAPMPVFRRP